MTKFGKHRKGKNDEIGKPQLSLKTRIVSWLVFLASLVVVLISVTSVVFPAFVIRSLSSFKYVPINPFEPGVWTYPFLIGNFVLLAIAVAYSKKKLPQSIVRAFKFAFNFEVSAKTAFAVIAGILTIYVILSAHELATEDSWSDWIRVKEDLKTWDVSQFGKGTGPNFKMLTLFISQHVLGNVRIAPLLESIALLALTYFVTVHIAKKRFAGIVAMIVLLQSNIFLTYDTSATYDNLWILMYLLSLYLIYKIWPLSPVSFVLSILSKALTAIFFPMTLFFIYKESIQRRKKLLLALSYAVIVIAGIAIQESGLNITGTAVSFSSFEFWTGFTSMAYQMRYDPLILIFILPVTIGLFVAARRGIAHADSIMFLIMGMLLSAPLLTGFTEQTNQPYRFVPLVVFFAIGVGTILAKKQTNDSEAK